MNGLLKITLVIFVMAVLSLPVYAQNEPTAVKIGVLAKGEAERCLDI